VEGIRGKKNTVKKIEIEEEVMINIDRDYEYPWRECEKRIK